jgi:hypothetical protein
MFTTLGAGTPAVDEGVAALAVGTFGTTAHVVCGDGAVPEGSAEERPKDIRTDVMAETAAHCVSGSTSTNRF